MVRLPYGLRKAILLVGYKPAWSMYMRLLEDIVGSENVARVSFEDLADSNSDAAAELFGKLVNIYPDMPRRPYISEDRLSALLGEKPLCAYSRRHGSKICFYNYAKLIFGSEKMPEPVEGDAFWKRWVVIEFNEVPVEPGLYEELKSEIEYIKLFGLVAFARALRRGSFSE